MIKAENLSKTYHKKIAVNNASFTVETGRVTGFLGPNGAGKSTAMRLMTGLDNGGGVTTFDGKRLNQYARPSQVIGILLEAKAFHPTRSAINHLRVLAAAGGIDSKRVGEVLDTVGLKDVAKNKPGKFSLGMSQRLGIAAAILGNPKYLLLDEPANGLDPEGIRWLRQFIKDYADQGNGVLVSSHLLSEMSLMADDIVVIGKGEILATDTVDNFIAATKGESVFVRSAKQSVLERILKQNKLDISKTRGGLIISGAKTDEIGKLAFQAGVPILELTRQTVSLEDAFLEATAGAQEYKAGGKTK